MLVNRLLLRLRDRNLLVILNTATVAGTNAVLLLGAARSMSAVELSAFSLMQLIGVTAVMLQRAFFLTPALASQRIVGRSLIPVRWSGQLSIPGALLVGIFVSATMGGRNEGHVEWFFLGFVSAAVVLVQDALRFCLLSRNSTLSAVASDAIWLAQITVTLFLGSFFSSAASLIVYWSATGIVAIVVAMAGLRLSASQGGKSVLKVRQCWRLGKWSGLDAFMSAAANLTPMLMSALVLGSEHAGIYRVLQSSLGPLNILSTSLMTMFGLDAWKFISTESLGSLRSTVRKAMLSMVVFALAYIALAEVVIIAISEQTSPDLLRIAIIVGLVGVIGAATAPLSAAALALGYQRDGALMRLVIVTFALAASFLGTLGSWLPWNDPIGTVTIFAAVTGLVGWSLSYRRAMKVEARLVATNP